MAKRGRLVTEALCAFVIDGAEVNELDYIDKAIIQRRISIRIRDYRAQEEEAVAAIRATYPGLFEEEFSSRNGLGMFTICGEHYNINRRGDHTHPYFGASSVVIMAEYVNPLLDKRRAIRVFAAGQTPRVMIPGMMMLGEHYYFKMDEWEPPLRLVEFVSFLMRVGYIKF